TALRYPGKVLAVDDRLFVADTGHHRVVEVDPDSGSAVAVWGSGSRGFTDGIGVAASFDQPHGLTIDDARTTLYVADTGNHAIRTVDLATGEVRTLAGTGELGWPPSPGTLDTVVLNSPWDVEYRDGIIYVANAGSHQIWAIDPDLDVAAPLIGSAREGTANGEFATAELAQPSGIEISETGELFFADAESSSIRVALLDGSVTELVVGGDATLFEFGDVDGTGNEARLQHPLGVALGDGVLYIADTYNSKIKRVDTEAGSVTSWLGGDPGWADGADPRFNEPGGLSYSDGILWVADTNNHAIRRIDATTGFTSTLVVTGVDALATTESYDGPVTRIEGRTTLAPGDGTLVLAYELPSGFKVNPDAPSSISVDGVALSLVGDGDLTGVALPARVPVTVVDDGTSPVTIDVNLIYCAENAESLCFIDRMRWELTVEVGNGSSELTLGRRIDG
ncbi:MAG: hypothetical protein KDB69_09800, partial [Acidimicrobiia bacterium]|nr:hypothetical protein [Acidimicrobiia bacterium]